MRLRAAALLLAVLATPARADVLLPGEQHIGDGLEPLLTPAEPVTRAQMRARPTHFHLSRAITVTAVQLVGVSDLDNQLQVFIDDMSLARAGTLSGSCDTGGTCTYTLLAPLTLGPGTHTIWPDGGCTPTGFLASCLTGENDFGFAAINLVSAESSASRGHHRRRHLGLRVDGDDDYGGRWYPDTGEGATTSFSFTLDVARLLAEVRFHRLRDVASAPPKYARVAIDGTTVGELTANGDPFAIPAALALAAGSHTLSVTVGDEAAGVTDDISWDDVVLLLANNPATTPGAFNAVDPGGAAASGAITTKVAGADFAVDIVAVSGGGVFAAYAGTVTIELLDAASTTGSLVGGSNCDAGWTPVAALGTVVFTALDAGRKTVTLAHAESLREARLRMTDPALGVTGCSVDHFAIRPAGFANIVASHDSATEPGTAEALATGAFTPGTLPMHRAGRPFTVVATAVNAAGVPTAAYAGAPILEAGASLLGTSAGTASVSGWTASAGTLRSDAATYSEAGAALLELSDASFADVDADDTPLAQRRIGPSSFAVGRFVPDHFKLVEQVPARFDAACGSFTYTGQPFFFAATPVARILAVAADGVTVTSNYDGALYKLPTGGALPAATWAADAGVLDLGGFPSPDNSFVSLGGGISEYTVVPRTGGYAFLRGAPELPFDADIGITLNLVDADGITFAAGATPGFGRAVAGGGVPFNGAGANPRQVRFGRLALDHAHGSERLPLDVPLRVEYWGAVSGAPGFVRNLADGCTALAPADFDLLPAGFTSATAVTPLSLPNARLTLAAPNVPGQATVTADLAVSHPWLLADTNGDGAYSEAPAALATFGVYRNESRRIYLREVYAP